MLDPKKAQRINYLEPKNQSSKLKAPEDQSLKLLSATQIFQLTDDLMGLSQRSAMLLLLKMKRTKRIIPQQIAQEDNTIQHFYNVGDLLEIICQLPPFDDVLANLARNTSKSKEEILMNIRGLFSRSEGLITIERGDYVVINGLGRLPLKYQESLLQLRNEMLQNIEGFLRNVESLTSGKTEMARTFRSLLEGILWLCAILEPEMEMEDQFSFVTSRERFQISERKSMKQYIAPRTSLEIGAAKKVSSDTIGNIYGSMKSEMIIVSTSGVQPRKNPIFRIHYFANSAIEYKPYTFIPGLKG